MATCPVCGFNGLPYEIAEHPICPSCYTEFGYDDTTMSFEALRNEWLSTGPMWQGVNVQPIPPNWDPIAQLQNLGVTVSNPNTVTLVTRKSKEFEMPINFQGSFCTSYA